MKSLSIIALLLVLTSLNCPGCSEGQAKKDGATTGTGPTAYPYRVATTVGMITDIVQVVAGDKATVEGIIKGDGDPHTFKPSRSDRIALQEADVIFYNGLMLEGKMSDVFVSLAGRGKPVFAVTQLLDNDNYVITDEEKHYDPHVWMDVRGWIHAVEAVSQSLSEYDKTNAALYDANAKAYLAQLQSLDAYARSVIASIPADKRVLITAHDAFGYMGRAYELKVMGVQGISTESEAGLRHISGLVNFIVQNKIAAVFIEASVSEKNIKALIEGAAAQGHAVVIGGKLYSDSMGTPGTYEGTYIGMIDHNVSTIAKALGGSVPEGGFKNWKPQAK